MTNTTNIPAAIPVLRTRTLIAGPFRSLHVFTPALRVRQERPDSLLPTLCVLQGGNVWFFEKVLIAGESELVQRGAGRDGDALCTAQVVLRTEAALTCYTYHPEDGPLDVSPIYDTAETVLAKVIARYARENLPAIDPAVTAAAVTPKRKC